MTQVDAPMNVAAFLNQMDFDRLKPVLDYIAFSLKTSVFLVGEAAGDILYEASQSGGGEGRAPGAREEIERCIRDARREHGVNIHTCSQNLKIVPFPLEVNETVIAWIVIGPIYIADALGHPLQKTGAKIPVMTREALDCEIRRIKPITESVMALMHDKLVLQESKALVDASYARQKRIEGELENTVDELATIFENSQVGIMYLQGGRYLAKGNQRLADILGWQNPAEMAGISMRKLHTSEETFREFGEKYFNALAHGIQIHIEYQLARKNGEPVWCMISGKAVDRHRPADLARGVIWIIDDISKQKAYETDLKRLSVTDYLTGLFNRAGFETAFEIEIKRAQRFQQPLAMLLMDIDYFKSVNDTYGHDAGDMVLETIGALLTESFREIDTIARVGGEEFTALLPATDEKEAFKAAERFRQAVSRTCKVFKGKDIRFTVSTGVAVYNAGERFADVYRRADRALYAAKDAGRNATMVYSDIIR
ncbi:MAG: GGDEF domain-containing protein [Desulfobacter sp.]|nr:MAG: GGDEF domain-containing protein [Desulfobacter sp.]